MNMGGLPFALEIGSPRILANNISVTRFSLRRLLLGIGSPPIDHDGAGLKRPHLRIAIRTKFGQIHSMGYVGGIFDGKPNILGYGRRTAKMRVNFPAR